jgi:SAM-dependent methyltransferase
MLCVLLLRGYTREQCRGLAQKESIMTDQAISHYHQYAKRFQAEYDSVPASDVHAEWTGLLAQLTPGLALDIGAGSGRDALWLARQDWKVTAVEPADGLRHLGQSKSSSNIEWVDARLPELDGLDVPDHGYDLVLLSAVWMHLKPEQRPLAFQRMCECLSSRGIMIITLRFGPSDPDRPMYAVNVKELEALALQRGLRINMLSNGLADDRLQRREISWQTVCLQHKTGGHE